MVYDDSITEKVHPIAKRILVAEVGSHLVFLTEQCHCSIDDDSCACPERFSEDLDDVVEPAGDLRLLDSLLDE